MGFNDLPDDWPDRPLTEPQLVADVLDLVVFDRDRRSGALAVLICDDEARLVQPVVITDLEPMATEEERCKALSAITGAMGGCGSILVAIARRDGLSITDGDRVWARAAARRADADEVRLLGVHVVTSTGSREMPHDLAA